MMDIHKDTITVATAEDVKAPRLYGTIASTGERIKPDRRDALSLARLHQKGELISLWVPAEEQEAIL